VYTDLAVIDLGPEGGLVRELLEDINIAELRALTEWQLEPASDCRALRMPAFSAAKGAL
jgi:acyl CoA:acetate/3-ketoacid CoA transferase beta subunit